MACLSCSAELHELCVDTLPLKDGPYVQCCCSADAVVKSGTLAEIFSTAMAGKRTPKADETLKDVTSTGRKRASITKPIEDGTVCEWAGLKFAGGGVRPIIGCSGNALIEERGKYARHHGPDKNTVNNDLDNLHLICVRCHNRWHAANDEFYAQPRPPKGQTWIPVPEWKLHDKVTQATKIEIVQNEIYWNTRKVDRHE